MPGSQRCCSAASPPSTSATVAIAAPRNGPGVRGVAELLGHQREVEQLALEPAVLRRHDHAGDAELGELAPERLLVLAVALHDLPHPRRRTLLGEKALDRVLEQQLIF